MNAHTVPRKTLVRTGVFLLSVLLALALFTAGNLLAHTGLFDIGSWLGLPDVRAQGKDDPTASASAVSVGARVEEVGAMLDAESLYSFDQQQIDEASAIAIRALLEDFEDSHAIYYTAEEYAAYQRESQGEYAGIGVVLTLFDERATVLQVYADSPAEAAGVVAGDVVLAIDGQRKEWNPADASAAVHRLDGETVEIIWERAGVERRTAIVVDTVNIPTVISHLIATQDARVGYIYLRRFNSESAAQVRTALEELAAEGAESYILDLRGNPGGYVDQAVQLTSLFLARGEVVRVEERSQTKVYEVTGEVVCDAPLVVLVDGNSASASELTAAALQDHGRATIVGETTFGKGTVQNVRMLSYGGALRYTIAHYLSPEGRIIEDTGVLPDVVVSPEIDVEQGGDLEEPPKLTLEELLAGNLGSPDYHYRLGDDVQLDAALSALRR
ncbi:MAG: S41 family peptidase [Coriobacteriales bacterium]|jgi:carboxyl-terminal processing protease|nr:S41 family peptidase [Coriobacteriales bacterium]